MFICPPFYVLVRTFFWFSSAPAVGPPGSTPSSQKRTLFCQVRRRQKGRNPTTQVTVARCWLPRRSHRYDDASRARTIVHRRSQRPIHVRRVLPAHTRPNVIMTWHHVEDEGAAGSAVPLHVVDGRKSTCRRCCVLFSIHLPHINPSLLWYPP